MNKDGNIYKLKIVESSSPMSKRPGTPFRLGALGLMYEEYCYPNKEVTDDPITGKPNDLPIVTGYVQPTCDLSMYSLEVEGYVGDKITQELFHGENSNFFDRFEYDEAFKEMVEIKLSRDEISVKILQEFYGTVNVTIFYTNCLECTLQVTVDTLEPLPCEIGGDTMPKETENGIYKWKITHGRRESLFKEIVQIDNKHLVKLHNFTTDYMEFKMLKDTFKGIIKIKFVYTDGVECEAELHLDIEDGGNPGDGGDGSDDTTDFAIRMCDAATFGFRTKLTIDGTVVHDGVTEYINRDGIVQNYESITGKLFDYGANDNNLHPVYGLKNKSNINVVLELLEPVAGSDASRGNHGNAMTLDVYKYDGKEGISSNPKTPSGLTIDFDEDVKNILNVSKHKDSEDYWKTDYKVEGRVINITYTKVQ